METGHKNNNFISFVPKPSNPSELQPKDQNLYASKKSQPPKSYTFYHSTRNQSNSRLSFNDPQKKQYRFSSEQSEEPRRKTLSESSSAMIAYSSQQSKGRSPQVTHFHTENAFKKSMHVPQISCFKSDLSASQNYVQERSSIRQALGKSQSIQQERRTISTQMIESTIIMKQSQIEEQNRNFNITSETLEKKVQTHLAKKYSNIEDEFNALREKFDIIEAENKVLQKRNLDLVQQMLSSESIIRDFQQKQKNYEQSAKKSEDSIKISRNIITSLNEKIARIQKENQTNLLSLQESYQNKLIALENHKNEALKMSEAQVFELKLKLIDQNHQLEDKVQKEKRLLEEQTSNKLREQLSQKDQTILLLQQELSTLNDCLARLDSDLLKLDQENIRLDQENNRLATLNSQFLHYKPAVQCLKTENEQLKQDIHKLSEENINQSVAVSDLKAQRQALKDQVQKFKEQVYRQMEEITTLKSQVSIQAKQKELRDTEIQGLKIELHKYQSASQAKTEENCQIADLRSQLAAIKDIAHQLQHKLESSLRDRQLLASETVILKQEISDNKTFVSSLQKKYEAKKEEVDILQENIQTKDTQISQLNINLLNLQLQILDLKERIRKFESSPQGEGLAQKHAVLVQQYQKQIEDMKSTIADLKEKQVSTTKIILQLQNKIEQKDTPLQENNSQLQSQLLQIRSSLQKRDQEIKNLKDSLLSKENEIIELSLKIDSIVDDKSEGIPQTGVTQELEGYSQAKQKLQIQIIQNELLQAELNITKQQNQELSKEIKFLETLKYIEDTRQSRAVLDLKQQLRQSQEREEQMHRELQELKDLLKKQQQEYLITLDQEIKKITMIEEEDNLQHEDKKDPNIQEEEPSLLEGLPEYQKLQDHQDPYGNNQMFEAWLEKISQYSRQELISKIQELIFVNKSLHMKVSEVNQIEENSNQIIMNKIRLFQEIIEKYQLQITELQEQNQVLRNQTKDLADRCHFFQGKIEWMDTIYKEVQQNLLQTNEELLKVQVQYINLKMSQETQDIADEQPSEPHQEMREERLESNDCLSKNVESSMSEDQAPQAIEKKEIIIQELKEINLVLQEEIEKVRSSQSSQKQESPESKKMEQQQWRLQDQRRQDVQLRRFMEGEYYIKQSEVRGVTYSIVVSEIDSEDEQYYESPQKEQIDIDKMIEEYHEQPSSQEQIPFLEPAEEEQVKDGLPEKQVSDEREALIVQPAQMGQNNKNTELQQKEIQEQPAQIDLTKSEKAE